MNHAALGLLECNAQNNTISLLLPPEILHPLGIADGGLLHALYYPQEAVRKTDHSIVDLPMCHDIVVTPIPYRLWPRVGLLRARLLPTAQAIQEFSDFLRDNQCSILHSEATRSAYRFSTWNIVVAFDDVDSDANGFDPALSVYRKTHAKVLELEKLIDSRCRSVLFKDESDLRLSHAFHVWPLATLAYFHHFASQIATASRWFASAFPLRYRKGHIFSSQEGPARAIVQRAVGTRSMRSVSTVFAHLDTRDLVIRLSFIPDELLHSFSLVTFKFTRTGYPDTSRGFMAYVMKKLPPKYRIWRVSNHTIASEGHTEIGTCALLVQDTDVINQASGQCHVAAVHHFLHKRDEGFAVEKGDQFEIALRVEPLTHTQIRNLLSAHLGQSSSAGYEHDVFLSYSFKDKDEARQLRDTLLAAGLRCFMAEKDVRAGDQIGQRIRDALVASREVCLLCSKATLKSEWVTTEWGAAWVLNRTITPILLNIGVEDLPERLRASLAVPFHNINSYVDDVLARRESHIDEAVLFD